MPLPDIAFPNWICGPGPVFCCRVPPPPAGLGITGVRVQIDAGSLPTPPFRITIRPLFPPGAPCPTWWPGCEPLNPDPAPDVRTGACSDVHYRSIPALNSFMINGATHESTLTGLGGVVTDVPTYRLQKFDVGGTA